MPKSPSDPKSSDPANRPQDLALRKKKNADAQAAFRARRANYIATLEETVNSLESVVLQLQDSVRETRAENLELRQENARLRHESREREKTWRAFMARRSAQGPDSEEAPPLSAPFVGDVPSILHPSPYPTESAYRTDDSPSCQTPYNPPATAFSTGQPQTAPFPHHGEGSAAHRGGKYSYSVQSSLRDTRWAMNPSLSAGIGGGEHAQPPAYSESPSLTSADSRFFGGEGHKSPMNSLLDNAPYVFPSNDRYQTLSESIPNSRSLSPSTSTPSSSTSLPLTSFHFPFQEAPGGQDRAEFDYRRHSMNPEATLHGGTADISLARLPDPVRFRLGRRPDSVMEQHSMVPAKEPSEEGDMYNSSRGPSRRDPLISNSRSPSPGATPLSCTVAVIKAQAFGALRRTRTKTKKSLEGAAKVAADVLESRGLGSSNKRPRLDEDDDPEEPIA